MGTNIRPETTRKSEYWIERQRYYELKHFCMQYRTWEKECRNLDSMVKALADPVPAQDDGSHSDPTGNCVMLRNQYRKKMDMLHEVATETDEELGHYILAGIVMGIPYDIVKQKMDVPCCKDVYYDLYRRFFWLLDKRRDECMV